MSSIITQLKTLQSQNNDKLVKIHYYFNKPNFINGEILNYIYSKYNLSIDIYINLKINHTNRDILLFTEIMPDILHIRFDYIYMIITAKHILDNIKALCNKNKKNYKILIIDCICINNLVFSIETYFTIIKFIVKYFMKYVNIIHIISDHNLTEHITNIDYNEIYKFHTYIKHFLENYKYNNLIIYSFRSYKINRIYGKNFKIFYNTKTEEIIYNKDDNNIICSVYSVLSKNEFYYKVYKNNILYEFIIIIIINSINYV